MCIYIYIHIIICVYIYIYIYVCMCIYIYIYIIVTPPWQPRGVPLQVPQHPALHVPLGGLHERRPTYIYIYIYIYAHTHIHIIYFYFCTYLLLYEGMRYTHLIRILDACYSMKACFVRVLCLSFQNLSLHKTLEHTFVSCIY